MRILRKIALALLGICFVLIVAALFLGRLFEDELTRYALDGLNRRIRTRVEFTEVRLSFLKNFPDATLDFRNVFTASVPDFNQAAFDGNITDTLLMARHMFFRFNVLKVLRKQYLVKEIRIRQGQLNLYVDPEGKANYSFWNSRQSGGDQNFLLEIDNVGLDDIQVSYDNRALQILASGMLGKCTLNGRFSNEEFSLSARLEGMLDRYVNRGTLMLGRKSISGTATMKVDPQAINITEAGLGIAGQQLRIDGIILRPKPLEFDLNLEGKQLDLEGLLRHFALSSSFPADLRAGGNLDLTGSVKGIASNTEIPQISAGFSLQEGWLQSPFLPGRIREVRLSGTYSNGRKHSPETTLIVLKNVSLRYGNSRIGGDYSVRNLIRPDFNYKIKSELDLSDLQGFKSVDTLFDNLEGKVQAEVSIKGDRALIRTRGTKDLLNYEYKARLRLDGVGLTFGEAPYRFSNFRGDAVYSDHLEVTNLNGIFGKSQVSLSGRVDNLLEYLFSTGANLWLNLDVYSERVDLFQPGLLSEGDNGEVHNDSLQLPENLYLKARFWFDELQAEDFAARQVTGDLVYKPGHLNVSHLEANSMNGRIVTEGFLEQQNDHRFLVKTSSKITSVDITEAFRAFHNFGQDFIVERHIKGSLSGDVDFSAALDGTMKILKPSVLTDCNVVIRNGELTGFEPMLELSKYIEVEELSNVRFSTLTNEIFIRNEEVVIPNMDIHSSAFDITASGLHGFDGRFTDKVKVSLSELLARKSRRPTGKDAEFGEVVDDGLGRMYLYLIVEGTPEEISVRYDRRGAMQNVRDQMKDEKKELKQILHEEFGLFRKDTTLEGKPPDRTTPGFIIHWDEDSTIKRDVKGDNNSGKERFIIEWDDDVKNKTDSIPALPEKKRKRK